MRIKEEFIHQIVLSGMLRSREREREKDRGRSATTYHIGN